MSKEPPKIIPECEVKPLKYKDWQKEFCPTDNVECTAEEAFATAVNLGSPEIETVKALLQGEDLELSPDLTKVRDRKTGKERPAQDALTKLAYKQGRAGALPQCQANPQGKVSIVGVEKPCQDVMDEVVNYLYSQGYSPTSEKGTYRRGTMERGVTKTLAKAAQELDMVGPNLLKLYQSAITKMKNRQEAYEKLMTGFKEGLSLQAKVGDVNPLAPVVGCYATRIKGLTLCITQDPVEIALKSTGRPWERNSCERITGVYPAGFIDDIGHNAAVAFAVDSGGNVLGRKMIRWGNPPTPKEDEQRKRQWLKEWEEKGGPPPPPLSTSKYSKFCAGIEPVWYSTGLRAKVEQALDEKLIEVIHCNHLAAEECETPYGYRGYSDAMGAGNLSSIHYGALGVEKRGEYLIGYLRAYYRENAPFIFKADRLTYAQIQFLRQHDFEWASTAEAARVYWADAHYGELPYYEIRTLEDLQDRLPCEDYEAHETTDEEKYLATKIEPFLIRTSRTDLEHFIRNCLPEITVKELLQTGDMSGRSLFLATSESNYHFFTENDTEYQGYMDEYVAAVEDESWYFVEEKFRE